MGSLQFTVLRKRRSMKKNQYDIITLSLLIVVGFNIYFFFSSISKDDNFVTSVYAISAVLTALALYFFQKTSKQGKKSCLII